MSVASPTAGELFTVRVFKRLLSNPSLEWANNYEIRAGSTPSTAELEAACNVIVDFEAQMHLTTVRFDRYTLSTFVADGSPYNPESFVSIPLTLEGERTVVGDPCGLEDCLFLRRDVQFGRDGRLLYRGALLEGDVSAPAGSKVMTNPSNFVSTQLNPSIVGSGIGQMFLTGSLDTKLVMAKTETDVVRVIGNIALGGVTTKKLNNRYFRTTP